MPSRQKRSRTRTATTVNPILGNTIQQYATPRYGKVSGPVLREELCGLLQSQHLNFSTNSKTAHDAAAGLIDFWMAKNFGTHAGA